MRAAVIAIGLVLAACGDGSYVVVTVDARPAVHDVATLRVSLTNAGTTRSDDLAFAGAAFPTTFSISAPGRTGDLTIAIDAIDADMNVVGHGEADTSTAATAAAMLLDTADFVVNTDYAGDQFLTDEVTFGGLQLAATTDGTWTTVFRDDCSAPCNMDARRFTPLGAPANSVAAAGSNAFALSSEITDQFSEPSVASAGSATIGVWNFDDDVDSQSGIACRPIAADGSEPSDDVEVALEAFPDEPTATGLATGNFALTWSSETGSDDAQLIRGAIVRPDCTTVAGPFTVGSGDLPAQSAVAASGAAVLYAWIDDGSVHVRLGTATSAAAGSDLVLLPATATQQAQAVRVTAFGSGFAAAVRWVADDGISPGTIALDRISLAGARVGAPTVVTAKAGSDFASLTALGLALRADGALLVVWSACADNGDGNGCGAFGRLVRPTGVPVGDAFVLATTTLADQTNPSAAPLADSFAVAWNDTSGQAPDHAGSAVRARVIYPAYDDATGVIGAPCSASAPCGTGLTCATGTDLIARCFETCTLGSAGTCTDGGTCATSAAGDVCAF
jgi:hypothetical protein